MSTHMLPDAPWISSPSILRGRQLIFVLRIEFIDSVGPVTGYTAWKQRGGIRVMGFDP